MTYYFEKIERQENLFWVRFRGTGFFFHGIMIIFQVLDNQLKLIERLNGKK